MGDPLKIEEIQRLKAKVDKAKPNSDAHQKARLELGRAINADLVRALPSKTRRQAIRRILSGSAT